jgi:hypothetical protein
MVQDKVFQDLLKNVKIIEEMVKRLSFLLKEIEICLKPRK